MNTNQAALGTEESTEAFWGGPEIAAPQEPCAATPSLPAGAPAGRKARFLKMVLYPLTIVAIVLAIKVAILMNDLFALLKSLAGV
ncbi:MAG: hypothetical protein WBW41_15450 [Verrucomicrobiia bacterium]